MNRLGREASPYLLQHAHNPVDWYPWGDEALKRSEKEDKPILLSIGYSACHWCHVMERESFEDETTAKVMNELFVNIKVDREERPDLDHVYQLVVQLMGRSGGWPLTVFLTPQQKPFFAGTYFPPADRYGMPSFQKILYAVSEAYRTQRSEVDLHAAEIVSAISEVTRVSAGPTDLPKDILEAVTPKLLRRVDGQNGGFGGRPKFPSTMALDVLLHRAVAAHDDRTEAAVRLALDRMRKGGIWDHLGGGFHRYSTDERWLVPHFEKMLYDNALLLRLYVDAYRAFGDSSYKETARAIVAWLLREMTDPATGAFYATQDADSEGEEGKFFVWSRDEIAAALLDADLTDLVARHFGIDDRGNFEETGKTVLSEVASVDQLALAKGKPPSEIESALESARERLRIFREKRPRPFRDEKILASWNALMIGALAEAAMACREPDWLAAAKRAFSFVEEKLVRDGRVQRLAKDGVVKGPGFLDDQSFFACAALDLYEATGESAYIEAARRATDVMLERFAGTGGLYLTSDDAEKILVRPQDPHDNAIPSGASMAYLALLRLGAMVDAKYMSKAEELLGSVATRAIENPFGFGQTLIALDRLVRGSLDCVVIKDASLAAAARDVYVLHCNLVLLDDGMAAPLLAEGKPLDKRAAYVCVGRTCSLPITDATLLKKALVSQISG